MFLARTGIGFLLHPPLTGAKRYRHARSYGTEEQADIAQDYYATRYSAEIVNTLTNLLFMFLAVKGILNTLQNGHDRIFLITFIGYLCVGSGSFAFHATLKCEPTTSI